MTKFQDLPEECIATILSRTTPADAGRFSLISKTFRSSADSDAVWNQFLPSDSDLVASVVSQYPSLANAPTKKALYLALSDRPLIIDNGHKSFQLDRKSGKLCYMLSARSLAIIWSSYDEFWDWVDMPDSRFGEVAVPLDVCWLEICGTINTSALSPNTEYAAYLVFKSVSARGYPRGYENRPIELSVFVEGGHSSIKIVCLDPKVEDRSHDRVVGLQCPIARSDGWLEIEMGEFFNSGIENEEVQMKVLERDVQWKRGLFLEGIEVRPKQHN